MTDIVERLREAFAVYNDSLGKRLVDEAADEIERLRARIIALERGVLVDSLSPFRPEFLPITKDKK